MTMRGDTYSRRTYEVLFAGDPRAQLGEFGRVLRGVADAVVRGKKAPWVGRRPIRFECSEPGCPRGLRTRDVRYRDEGGVRRIVCATHKFPRFDGEPLTTKNLQKHLHAIKAFKMVGTRRTFYVQCAADGCPNLANLSRTTSPDAPRCPTCKGRWKVADTYTSSRRIYNLRDRIVGHDFIYRTVDGKRQRVKRWLMRCATSACGTLVRYMPAGAGPRDYGNQMCRRCRGKLRRKRPYEAAYNVLCKTRQGVPNLLTYAAFARLCAKPQCHYCDMPLNRQKWPEDGKKKSTLAIMLDRKDNTKGYVPGNVVPCCGVCNITKFRLLSPDEMRLVALARNGKLREARKHLAAALPKIVRHGRRVRRQNWWRGRTKKPLDGQ